MITKKCKMCEKSFLTKDKRQKFCSQGCYHTFNQGSNNHFYNKKHTKSSIDKMKLKLSEKLSGEKNPFYGKKHSFEAINTIKEKNKNFRSANQDALVSQQLSSLGLTKEKVYDIYNEYKNGLLTQKAISEKFKLDFRTIKKYIVYFGIASKDELNNLSFHKKYKKTSSMPEENLFEHLQETFKDEVILRQFRIGRYSYDFKINNILIEYDGYYWHQLIENNDLIKNQMALDQNYILYRVIEPESRVVDFAAECKIIKEIYESQKNK